MVIVVRIEKTTLFRMEERCSMLLRNRCKYLPKYTVSDSTTEWSSRDRTVHLITYRMRDTNDTTKVPCQKYKTPLHQYKIQGGYHVNSTRLQLFNTRYKGLPSQQYKTPVLQYEIQGATKPKVQEASSSIQGTRGYQDNSTRRHFFNTRYKRTQVNSTRRNFISTRYKGDTMLTVQDASSLIQDTRGTEVNSTRRQFFSTRYKGVPSQQYKTLEFYAQRNTTWKLATRMPTMSVYQATNVKEQQVDSKY
jgi:hypothetical protein